MRKYQKILIWIFLVVVFKDFFINLNNLKEMKKYVSKLILNKNIIQYDDQNCIGTFQQYIDSGFLNRYASVYFS